MRTKDLVSDRLASAAADTGLTFVDDPEWGNVGTYRFYRADLSLAGEVTYNYQPNYSCFEAAGLDGIGYVAPADLAGVVERLANYVKAEV